ncbi:MAG: hypothetical protein LBT44_02315 [Clostridiales bacterium]|jgi:hypothetical protein|nr:hypothetical protein [Clostridiales bacterium]
MKWKTFILWAALAILIAAFGLTYYYTSHVARFSERTLNSFMNGGSRGRQDIFTSVLLVSGKWRAWGKPSQYSLDVRLERLKGKQKDALVILKAGAGQSLIAYYEKRNGYYQYRCLIDSFTDLLDVQVIPLAEQNSGLILVRDHKGPMPETREESVFICAYAWEDGRFTRTLNLRESYQAYYNELWDQNKPAGKCHWIHVAERADILWENANNPVIHVLTRQTYALSQSVSQAQIPAGQDFELVRSRDILEEYVWSGKWMHFILFEGTDTKNAEPVAVLEDLSDGPFGLIGQFTQVSRKYRVKYIDGTIDIVDKERVRPGIQIKGTRVI